MKTMLAILISAGLLGTVASAQEPKAAVRKQNQQARIAQGVRSGQMTAGETARVERKEGQINRETRADRAANGGKLSPGEKRTVNRQQNRVSARIYNDKHNAVTQHP